MGCGRRVAGREPREEFPCSACSESLPEEMRKTGLGFRGGAKSSRRLLVPMRPAPSNPVLCGKCSYLFLSCVPYSDGDCGPWLGLEARGREDECGSCVCVPKMGEERNGLMRFHYDLKVAYSTRTEFDSDPRGSLPPHSAGLPGQTRLTQGHCPKGPMGVEI